MNANFRFASLYVGDLHPDTQELDLLEKFSIMGPLLSARVCRHFKSGHSLGYGYVNFKYSGDAKHALNKLNFEIIKGRPIRLMWSLCGQSLRKIRIGNIFIGNLAKSVDSRVLFDTFSVFGNILNSHVVYDKKGTSKGYGFVHFENEEVANEAIFKANGKLLNDKIIIVNKSVTRSEFKNNSEVKNGEVIAEPSKTNVNYPKAWKPKWKPENVIVFVKYLEDSINEERLIHEFSLFGSITSVKIVKENGKSKGYGFVSFSEVEDALEAVSTMNRRIIETKPLFVALAQSKEERDAQWLATQYTQNLHRQFVPPSVKKEQNNVGIYVKYLEDSIDEERLKHEFSLFGAITSVKIIRESGESMGYGFIYFSEAEDALEAISAMNHRIIETKPLFVTLVQSKEEREAQRFTARFPQNLHPQLIPPVTSLVPTFPIMQMYQHSKYPASINTECCIVPTIPNLLPVQQNHFNIPRLLGCQPPVGQQFLCNTVLEHKCPHYEKQMLRPHLFAMINSMFTNPTEKITDILLKIDNSELVHIMENPELLMEKVKEALVQIMY